MVSLRSDGGSGTTSVTESRPLPDTMFGIFCRPNGHADMMHTTCPYGSCTTLAFTASDPFTDDTVFTIRIVDAGTHNVEWLADGVVKRTQSLSITYPLHVRVEVNECCWSAQTNNAVVDIQWV